MDDNKVYFSPPEEEMIDSLKEIYGIGHLEACETVISYKRQNAFIYQQRGNLDLAEVLLKEIGEWSDIMAEEFEKLEATGKKYKKIILPS